MSEVLLGYVCFIFATGRSSTDAVLFLSTTYMANCWILWPLLEEHGLFWTAGFFLIIFNLSFVASMVTYMSACFRDPGYVPKMNVADRSDKAATGIPPSGSVQQDLQQVQR